jgi:Transcription factor WhiB
MSASKVFINNHEVGLDYVGIDRLARDVDVERGLYEVRAKTMPVLGRAAVHAARLGAIHGAFHSSFYADDQHPDSEYVDTAFAVLSLGPDVASTSTDYLETYSYIRAMRALTAEFGPDDSAVFKLLRQLAIAESQEIVSESVCSKNVDALGWQLGTTLIERVRHALSSQKSGIAESATTLLASRASSASRILKDLSDALEAPIDTLPNSTIDDDREAEESQESQTKIREERMKAFLTEIEPSVDLAALRILQRFGPEFVISLDVSPANAESLRALAWHVLGHRKLLHQVTPTTLSPLPSMPFAACKPSLVGSLVPIFFPGRGEDTKTAKLVCGSCMHSHECGDYATKNNINHGIWGGLSERERRRARRETGLSEETEDEEYDLL